VAALAVVLASGAMAAAGARSWPAAVVAEEVAKEANQA
jgi:hypothetical protein